jgi:menaquinone-9 beta-reductase
MIKIHDCAIVGGGLAGLTLAIQLSDAGHSVILFEKENYPFHKVCGEYISMESYDFLQRIGLPLDKMDLPKIKQLKVSAPNGNALVEKLDLGGFGLSRYTLDTRLADLAKQKGVLLLENTTVTDVQFDGSLFSIFTGNYTFQAKVVCGAYGKKSVLDRKLGRKHEVKTDKSQLYIGVKYHIKLDFPADRIELHNFKDGYCGISKVDQDRYCLCYLTTAENLNKNGNDIKAMEKAVLMQNPFLKQIFERATFLYDKPLSISNITFQKKSAIEQNILLLGDTAGTIAPLCGNGMSMAMNSSFLVSAIIQKFLRSEISRDEMNKQYARKWNKQFSTRIASGRTIQHLFGAEKMTNIAIGVCKNVPFLTRFLLGLTHGKRF